MLLTVLVPQVSLNYLKTKIPKSWIKQNVFDLLGYCVTPCIGIHNDCIFPFSKQGGCQPSWTLWMMIYYCIILEQITLSKK